MNFSEWLSAAKTYLQPGRQRRRLLMAVLGVVTCAVSVAFFKQAAFGTDPFQCMCNGLDLVVPIGYGTLYVLINAVLLIAVLLLDRHYIGVGTLINLFLYGYIVEFCEKGIYAVFGDPSMALRIGYLAFAVVVMCIASAIYFTADLGVSTYDFIALYLAKKQSKVPFRFIRIGTDLICAAIGFALGYIPGIGTIITAFFMGPLISFFTRRIAQPMLNGRNAA